jgi:hypothetical protein
VNAFEGRSSFIFAYFLGAVEAIAPFDCGQGRLSIAFAKIAHREPHLIRKAGKQESNGKARMKLNSEFRKRISQLFCWLRGFPDSEI